MSTGRASGLQRPCLEIFCNRLSPIRRILALLRCNEALDLAEQLLPCRIDFGRPVVCQNFPQRLRDDAEERDEQGARRAVGIMRSHFAFDQAEMAGARSGKVQYRVDGERQHRTLDEFAALGPEHRLRLGVRVEQSAIDPRRQILATRGGDFKASLDRIG